MSLHKRLLTTVMILAVAACVTINVYFPEAAAEQAATQFISGVLNAEEQADDTLVEGGETSAIPSQQYGFDPFAFLIPAAHAQQGVNIDINTPPIRAIQDRMRARQKNELQPFFEAGAIGYGSNAMLVVRDRSAVGLADRSKLEQVVAADNQDRAAVYREIAVANGHPEWEDEIRNTFAKEWVEQAQSGWYYQDAAGNWVQK